MCELSDTILALTFYGSIVAGVALYICIESHFNIILPFLLL